MRSHVGNVGRWSSIGMRLELGPTRLFPVFAEHEWCGSVAAKDIAIGEGDELPLRVWGRGKGAPWYLYLGCMRLR